MGFWIDKSSLMGLNMLRVNYAGICRQTDTGSTADVKADVNSYLTSTSWRTHAAKHLSTKTPLSVVISAVIQ